jgi:hypothetical protein
MVFFENSIVATGYCDGKMRYFRSGAGFLGGKRSLAG